MHASKDLARKLSLPIPPAPSFTIPSRFCHGNFSPAENLISLILPKSKLIRLATEKKGKEQKRKTMVRSCRCPLLWACLLPSSSSCVCLTSACCVVLERGAVGVCRAVAGWQGGAAAAVHSGGLPCQPRGGDGTWPSWEGE